MALVTEGDFVFGLVMLLKFHVKKKCLLLGFLILPNFLGEFIKNEYQNLSNVGVFLFG